MHSTQREKLILECLQEQGFISLKDLWGRVLASRATIRRDLMRLTETGLITRVHGGAKLVARAKGTGALLDCAPSALQGVPFDESVHRQRRQKEWVGREAAKLCTPGEAVMIDGGSTTLQMCPHLEGLNLQVLTNSLPIVTALLGQPGTRVLVSGGQVFPEQNIILSAGGDDGMPRFHAPKLFMGAAAVSPAGLMQPDVILVAAERRLIDRAKQIVVLVDSSKFTGPSGHVVCPLEEIDVLITDSGICAAHRKMLEVARVKTIIVRQ
jgi:DeoR family transcriptional regulator, ulaG and ulaABCDEF operon transcriptional repressor